MYIVKALKIQTKGTRNLFNEVIERNLFIAYYNGQPKYRTAKEY